MLVIDRNKSLTLSFALKYGISAFPAADGIDANPKAHTFHTWNAVEKQCYKCKKEQDNIKGNEVWLLKQCNQI